MASLYWVGGTGTWDNSTTTNWANTSGGAGGAGVPGSSADVFFDGNSGTGIVTVSSSVIPQCQSATFTGYTGTFSIGSQLKIGGTSTGGWTFVSGMTLTVNTGALLNFVQGIGNITTGGNSMPGIQITTGSYTLQDSFTCGATFTVTLAAGTLNTNGQTCSWGTFASTSSSVRTLTLGASAITITGNVSGEGWQVVSSNLTVTSNTAVITLTANSVSLNLGTNTNYNGMSIIITANGSVGYGVSTAGHIIANLTYAPSTGVTTNSISVDNAFTVTTSITWTGAAAPNVPLVQSNVAGTTRTITCNGTVSLTNRMDFQDITGAGTATWNLSTNGGDGGGNSGITLSTPQTNYWHSSTSASFSAAANWFLASGGTGGSGRSPFPQDTCIFDVNSTSTTAQCATDGLRYGTITCTGFTGKLNLNTNFSCYGNWTNGSGMTLLGGGSPIFVGRGTQTVTNAGLSWPSSMTVNSFGGTYTIQDNLTVTSIFSVLQGTFTATTQNIKCVQFECTGILTRTVNMGSGAWTLTATSGHVCDIAATGLTFNAGTSTIFVSDTSATQKLLALGAGFTFYNLQIASPSSGNTAINSSASWNAIITGQQSQLLLPIATTTVAPGGWQVSGGINGYQALPGVSGNYASTPDASPLDITSDIDLRVYVAMKTWTPASNQVLISKWGTTGATESWTFYLTSAGKLALTALTAALATATATSSVAVALSAGSLRWVRVTWQRSTGNSIFYTSTDGSTWTQLGATQALFASSFMNNSTTDVEVGSQQTGTNSLAIGNFYRAQIYNSIAGTLVFDANFAAKQVGQNSFIESSANSATVTISGSLAQQGDGRVLIASVTPGSAATVSIASGSVSSSYVSLQDNAAAGGAIPFRAINSVIGSNVTNWQAINASGLLPFF